MLLTRAFIILGAGLHLSSYASADPILKGPEAIAVPPGHFLVEVPAQYKVAARPIFEPTIESYVVVPGIYRNTVVNGVRRREIVRPPQRAERLRMGPMRTETVRVITYPKSYELQDQNGRIVKRFRWIKGKLTEV